MAPEPPELPERCSRLLHGTRRPSLYEVAEGDYANTGFLDKRTQVCYQITDDATPVAQPPRY